MRELGVTSAAMAKRVRNSAVPALSWGGQYVLHHTELLHGLLLAQLLNPAVICTSPHPVQRLLLCCSKSWNTALLCETLSAHLKQI